jgi:hypothetical protein
MHTFTTKVWKEDQTSQPLHWVAPNTGKLPDFCRVKGSEEKAYCKSCITNDSTEGVLALYSRRISWKNSIFNIISVLMI